HSDDLDLCAPNALRCWLEHRAARHADDPLFVGLRAGGVMPAARLSDKAVVRLVKDTAEAVGDGDPGLVERTFGALAAGVKRSYSGHSRLGRPAWSRPPPGRAAPATRG